MTSSNPAPASDHADLAIIGVSAAGMMAAIFAGRAAPPGARIVALDTAKKLGAKILVAGGGRCNVTHDVITPRDYAGSSTNQIKKVLKTFSVAETTAFFAELGVALKREETGKLFPVTDKARTVLDALLGAMRDAGVEVWTDARVTSLTHGRGVFTINGSLTADRVIIATGGLALPKTGSDGTGYGLLRGLGHSVTATTPALAPLILEGGHWLTKLSGVSFDAELTLSNPSGKVLHRQAGAVLATHFGISGPAVMDISRHWLAARPGGRLHANLAPGSTFEQVEQQLVDTPRGTLIGWLKQRLPERLAAALLRDGVGVDPKIGLAQLSRADRRGAAHGVTALPLPVVGDRGYKFAEATAGGTPLDEIDLKTMASRIVDGLYLCGEVLNVDGRIGGYNFQWAWCTGRLAGMAAAQRL